jgi:uncharacterized protein involved in type VI secretion and phage assembly
MKMKVNRERQILYKYLRLNELNNEPIQVWIDKLIEVRKEFSEVGGTIEVDDYGSIDFCYEIEETDEEYTRRIAREEELYKTVHTQEKVKAKVAELEQTIRDLNKQLLEDY